MLSTVSTQFNLIIFSVFAGMLTGILFDIYRVFRGLESPNKVITFIEDTLFWILTGIIVFIFLLSTNYAYIRVYVYCAIALGIILYIWLFSKAFIKVQYKLMKAMGKVLRICLNFIFYPLRLIIYSMKTKNKQKILKKSLEENKNRN